MKSEIEATHKYISGLNRKIQLKTTTSSSPESIRNISISADSGVSDVKLASPTNKFPSEKITEEKGKCEMQSDDETDNDSYQSLVILKQLEQLIITDEWTNKEYDGASRVSSTHSTPSQIIRTRSEKHLTEISRTLITSTSLKSYIDILSSSHRQSIASWLYGNASQILSTLLKFPNSNVYCSDCEINAMYSARSGIGQAVRLALRDVYGPEYCIKGWKIFVEKGAPVIYVSPGLHVDLLPYLVSEFGISDIVVLKKMESEMCKIEGRIDHLALEKQIENDISEGKLPLMVIGVVGSPILGQNDMISRLITLRKTKYRFWIHVIGQALAALCLKNTPEFLVHVLSQVDSFTLPLGTWLGIQNAPPLTMYRSVENYRPNYKQKLDTLPWWIITQYLSSNAIGDIIETSYKLSRAMLKGLATFPQIIIIGIDNPKEFFVKVDKGHYTPPTVLIFKYNFKELEEFRKKMNTTEGDDLNEKEKQLCDYADSLNCWLGQGLISNYQEMGLQMVELDELHGVGMRFCPLECSAASDLKVENVKRCINSLADALKIIESTVIAREIFLNMKQADSSILVMPFRKWAGVGAICYIPTIVRETPSNEWNDKQKQQISHLNLELVHSLRSVDTAFSCGESELYGVSCVKFGMLSDEKDLDDLVNLVSERGKEIEHSQKYLDSLAKMILQGIEAANNDLKKENDARLLHEGVMRQIPIMSSLVNWFSPLDKENQMKGRSFDLKTGQIQSTNIYYKNRSAENASNTSTPQVSPTDENSEHSSPQNVQQDAILHENGFAASATKDSTPIDGQ